MISTLKDFLLAQGELERYYDGAVPLNLWRGLNARRNEHLFGVVETPFKMSNGRIRRQDAQLKEAGSGFALLQGVSARLTSLAYPQEKIGSITRFHGAHRYLPVLP